MLSNTKEEKLVLFNFFTLTREGNRNLIFFFEQKKDKLSLEYKD